MEGQVTIPLLQQMKREGRKSVGVVAWDYPMATIADRAGVDFVSVGDSVGVNLWGHANPLEVTMEEMLVVCKAVRRATKRALVSCDFPFGPLQQGVDSALQAGIRLVKEGGADIVKLDGAVDFPDTVRALVRAGIPVFAQFGLTPQTALQYGVPYSAQASPGAQATPEMTAKLVRWRALQWRKRFPSRSSAGSAAAHGSMAACAWRIPLSAITRNGSMPRPRPM
jgi:3-methyl-2-oxobutanoate hydroxymethyltransferase